MSWLSNLFSKSVATVVETVGNIVDEIHTSDEEKEQLKIKLTEELRTLKKLQLTAIAQYDREVTKRWQSDNDYAITRLVRPVSFVFVMGLFAVVVIFDGNVGQFNIKDAYIPVIEGLLYTMVIAYFGSRGAEKITRTVKNARNSDDD